MKIHYLTPPILSSLKKCFCVVQPTKRICFLLSIASSKSSLIQTSVSQLELGLLLMIFINTTALPTFILSLQEISIHVKNSSSPIKSLQRSFFFSLSFFFNTFVMMENKTKSCSSWSDCTGPLKAGDYLSPPVT